MKKALTAGLAAIALAAMAVSASAKPWCDRTCAGEILPAYDILSSVRWAGLTPSSVPVLHGNQYVVRAVDSRGVELRVVTDAYFGTILSLAPALPYGIFYAPYGGGAHIIHVAQSGEGHAAPQYHYDNGIEVIVVPSQADKKQ